MPPLFTLDAPMLAATQKRIEDGALKIGFPLFDSVFSTLRKKQHRLKLSAIDDSIEVWQKFPFGKSDQVHAQREYSFVRMLPTVCLTAGVLTLSLTIGSGEKFVLQAKPARMGGLIGFRGRFD